MVYAHRWHHWPPQCIALWLLTYLLSCCPHTPVQPCLSTADSHLGIFLHCRAVAPQVRCYCICPSSTLANFSNKVGQIWAWLCTWIWALSDTQYLVTQQHKANWYYWCTIKPRLTVRYELLTKTICSHSEILLIANCVSHALLNAHCAINFYFSSFLLFCFIWPVFYSFFSSFSHFFTKRF